MQKIVLEITMSLDGYIAGPDISMQQPMGKGGLELHHWIFSGKTEQDQQLLEATLNDSGAVIVGGHTYRTAIQDAWSGESPFPIPAFVLCHQVPDIVVDGFQFITDGLLSALQKAKIAAGQKNVWVMGGAATIRQFLFARLCDELHIHIAPLLLGDGTLLFDKSASERLSLETLQVIHTPAAVHIKFGPANKINS